MFRSLIGEFEFFHPAQEAEVLVAGDAVGDISILDSRQRRSRQDQTEELPSVVRGSVISNEQPLFVTGCTARFQVGKVRAWM